MTEKHKAISETFGEFAHKSCDDSLSASELKAELKEREEKAKPLTDSIEEMKEILGEWKSWAKSRAELKKYLANKIFGYLARCDFCLKLGW